jgi:hypothetical protein
LRLIDIRKKLWRPASANCSPFEAIREIARHSQFNIQLFYAINLFIWIFKFQYYLNCLEHLFVIQPVWPLSWIENFSLWGKAAFFFNLITASLALIWPQKRLNRVLAFTGLFFLEAFFASDAASWERIGHSQCYTLIAFLFIFLPDRDLGRRSKAWLTTLIMTLASTTVLCSYVSSALWRVRESAVAVLNGGATLIGFSGLDRAIRNFSLIWQDHGILGEFFLENHWLSKWGMPSATIFELFALVVCFWPRLYRPYGIMLVFFHLGFRLLFDLPFDEHLLAVVAILVCSPFTTFSRLRPQILAKGES